MGARTVVQVSKADASGPWDSCGKSIETEFKVEIRITSRAPLCADHNVDKHK